MKKEDISLRDAFKNIGGRNIAAAVLVMILSLAFVAVNGIFLHSYAKKSITESGELAATRSAKVVDAYLRTNASAVSLAAYNVDRILKKGGTHEEILKYLEDETQHILATVDKDNNGVYGWIDGEYMDTVWVPDDDYVPKERPWYTEAVANENSSITFVKPYLDVQTGSVMMTVSARLDDGESVIAIDVGLDKLQDVAGDVAKIAAGSIGIVLDEEGFVVAHSDVTERGKSYSDERGTLGAKIASQLSDGDNYYFEVDHDQASYIVYVVKLEAGWNAVSVINADVVFRPLKMIIIISAAAALLLVVMILIIFLRISTRNLIAQNLNVQLASVADIYMSMHDIDLERNTYRTISCRDEIANYMNDDHSNAQEALYNVMNNITDEMSKSLINKFIDLSTLPERLTATNTVIEEFLNNKNQWCRARFITAERSPECGIRRVIWVIESIDDEKRRRDRLQYLSETDMMTGLNNRGSGENKVTKLINQGLGGMFVVLDADRFKSINDNFGHGVGDKVLVALANAIKKSFRVDDIVMRLGGDEFAAYAVGVFTEENGRKIMERLFSNVAGIEIPELGGAKIEVSVGAVFSEDNAETNFSELYKAADRGTYASKNEDGSRVTFV